MVRPSTADDIAWASELAVKVYDHQDAMPAQVMLAWFQANPTGFSTLWYDDQRVGNFHILPLKPDVLTSFINGRTLERDFSPEGLYTAEESHSIQDLYWESAVLDPAFRGEPRKQMLTTLIADFSNVFGRVCKLDQIRSMYAIAASSRGSEYLALLGMAPIGDAGSRLDKHQLYYGTLGSFQSAIAILLSSK